MKQCALTGCAVPQGHDAHQGKTVWALNQQPPAEYGIEPATCQLSAKEQTWDGDESVRKLRHLCL